jgi:multicomponent K+:H+ antiporter subunit F
MSAQGSPVSLLLSSAISLTLLLYAVAMIVGLLRLARGPSAQDRILALDFLYVVGMLVMLVLAIRADSEMYFEGAMLMVLFGFVGSVALAKFLLRGEAIE